MTPQELQYKKAWLESAEKRLASLCSKFASRAEDYDVLPTQEQQRAVLEFLKHVNRTDAPQMGTTVNADITLMWLIANDKYKVYVEPNGKVTCFHNKKPVQQSEFCSVVARVLA